MAVREGLLALLRERPSHGYQLKIAFEAATGGTWPLNVGQVYTTLDRLQRDGFVTSDEVDGQKRYALSPAGREELGAWWSTLPSEAPPPRDELLLKVLLAIQEGPDHALDLVTRHRTALTQLLQIRRRATRPGVEGDLASALVADALVARAEADLRWLDTCEARILRARSAPLPPTTNGDTHG